MKSSVLGLAFLVFAATTFAASDLDTSFQALQSAEKANDLAQIKKTAPVVYGYVHQAMSEAEPADTNEQQHWKDRIEYAKSIEAYADYLLYTAALKATPDVAVDFIGILDQQSPKSKYLDNGGYALYFEALEKTGAKAKVPLIAEKAVARFPSNPDILLALAENAMVRKQGDAALRYSKRLITATDARAKEESKARTDSLLARGYWMAGVTEGEKNNYIEANRDLRAALPLIQENDAMLGPAYFYLGVANYQLGKQTFNRSQIAEAEKFSERAAAIKTSYSNQAWINAQLIKAELAKGVTARR